MLGKLFADQGTSERAITADVNHGVSIASRISRFCTCEFADVCAVYLQCGGAMPAGFATRDPQRLTEFGTLAYDGGYTKRIHEAGITTLIEEPLVVHERTVGVLILGLAPHRVITAANRRLIRLICTALSAALQQAEELARLAHPERLAIDAAFRPASSEAAVGGDWYDVFEIGDGTFGISVGDVSGHGLEAAVTMSEIRQAIRLAALNIPSPATLINHIDSMLNSRVNRTATAIVGIYDPDPHTLRYACAGHPAPILLSASNAAQFLPAGGLLLGLGRSPASPEYTVTIAPGSTCFLYTDGLLEHDRDAAGAEHGLITALERLARDGRCSAQELHADIFGATENSDDCTTLALHSRDAGANAQRFIYSTMPIFASVAREALRHYAQCHGIGSERQFNLLAASGEAIANAIEHGAHVPGDTFSIDMQIERGEIMLRIESSGRWRTSVPREERGRGMQIMRSCSSHVDIMSSQNRTYVTLTFAR